MSYLNDFLKTYLLRKADGERHVLCEVIRHEGRAAVHNPQILDQRRQPFPAACFVGVSEAVGETFLSRGGN
jgi:hypothetical protein